MTQQATITGPKMGQVFSRRMRFCSGSFSDPGGRTPGLGVRVAPILR